jgi:ribosomal protein S18 acetylase RimI-like enzyme
VGARLMSTVALDLTYRAFNAASLWALRENAVARAFYKRLGGQGIEEREAVRKEATLVEVAYGWSRTAPIAFDNNFILSAPL